MVDRLLTNVPSVESRQPIRHREETQPHYGGAFDGTTTHRADFGVKHRKICPAELVLSRRDRSYKLLGNRGGHRFYRRVRPGVPAHGKLSAVEG